jgi:hypothetical protein
MNQLSVEYSEGEFQALISRLDHIQHETSALKYYLMTWAKKVPTERGNDDEH